ncbi:MAG: oxaloacetate decarboxylase [Armatimonadota bacterium]|nr:oxaloacetate decarboxylase [Armatimonadota bacterium]MDR7452134.1 oxaloacetate decarboxylase [Armatimonadota bacterium]MDR7467858.1 oxaloacetate decarboxylase [Armatimonadota bacterium]MDR7494746.1 oxaloacetate decarboxylase [Armatimonadota bacterium]MDR7499571.1 oxaloacetate decarboxylase [Armatimonadota bacterium]
MTGPALRERLSRPEILVAPGVHDALAARIAERAGFEALYFTGAGFAYTHLGMPDLGLVSLSETVARVAAIADATRLPLIADGDTGYGNALNVGRTVREFERAGAAAIQLEDQTFPKRCGHLAGKTVIRTEEMVGKIKAAVDARREGILVIGRTDARAVEGFDAALERALRYKEAGADILFVEAPESRAELERLARALPPPAMANMVEGGATPLLSARELEAMGYRLVIFPGAAVRAAAAAMVRVMAVLRQQGTTEPLRESMLSFAELNDLLGLPEFQRREERYLKDL